MMAKKSVLYDIYSDLVTAMKNVVEPKYIFLKDRPKFKEGELPMSKFVVVDLMGVIKDFVVGNQKTMLTTSAVVYLFVQARSNGTLDVNAMGNFVDSVHGLFPIKGEYCVGTNPNVLFHGEDGNNFQVASISFDLRCRWRAFD